ncbi:MAG: extracellular solute-binding protein [Corallococcus sp.]|nr:extracellular solute-binding protein [Bacillota bacterium]MCM1533041.1 extracellular solute-binding protein [Corallococcus sp.]
MKKILCLVLVLMLVAGSAVALTSCDSKEIIVWGPGDHEEIYLKWTQEFMDMHPEAFEGYKVTYAGSGDSGAYSAMNVDPTSGAAVYTFANDQMANLLNLAALSPVTGDNLAWSQANNDARAFAATFMGEQSWAYPLQADNGYYMYYNKAAFRGTAVWDDTNDCLMENYTFRQLYEALDSKTDNWKKGKVTWAMGDSWYASGVFFAVGGDYEIGYDGDGRQNSADCWFSYTLPEGVTDKKRGDYTVGFDAYECMKNSITTADGKISDHYLYTDGDKNPLNDKIDLYSNPANFEGQETPLAAAVCGTWKAKTLKEAWGDDYGATVLPMLETDDGEMFAMKNFAGYKHMGVNPQCKFANAVEDDSNLKLLHELAKYLCGKEISLERYEATGAGPANLEALADPDVAADAALLALNAQYDRVCKYPMNYAKEELRGQDIGNGLGYRVQDSVPANYWTPIQTFSNTLYNEISGTQPLDKFKNMVNTRNFLAELQTQISQAAQ